MPYLDLVCSSRVENAIRYRPSYPYQLIEYLYTDAGFSRESVIADIGSGTGAFTRLLLERGSRVVAIEPDDLLRIAAERLLSDEFQRFVSIKGTPIHTTLCNASIQHIVCAHSLYWSDLGKCRDEFYRILKPQGTATIIWNRLMVNWDAFNYEYEQLLKRCLPGRNAFQGRELKEFSSFFGTHEYAFISLPHQQVLDFEGVKGALMAHEGFHALGEESRTTLLSELYGLFERYNQSGKVILRYETEAYTMQLGRAS